MKRATEKRIYDDEGSDYSVSDKSVQVSPRVSLTRHRSTQTNLEDSGIASGVYSVQNSSALKTSSAPVHATSKKLVFEHPMPSSSILIRRSVSVDSIAACEGSRLEPLTSPLPKMSYSKVCHIPSVSASMQTKSAVESDFSDGYSPPRQSFVRTWPKMSVTHESCCVTNDNFSKSKSKSLIPYNPVAVSHIRSQYRPPDNRMENVLRCPAKNSVSIKTSTPTSLSHGGTQRKERSRSSKHSRLEELWRLQHEIIATMNVDLDADSETSFEHDRW